MYCDYCRTFLMTEAKRKTKQISKIQPRAPSRAHLRNRLGGVFRSAPSTHSASPNRVDILLTSPPILKNFNKLFIFLLMFFLHLGLQLEGKSLTFFYC